MRGSPLSPRRMGRLGRVGAVKLDLPNESEASTEIVFTGGGQYRVLDQGDVDAVGQAAPTDFYEMLGVDISANKTNLKKAYRGILKYCHPDKAGAEATEFCTLVNVAYDILTNDVQRKVYDVDLEQYRETQGDSFDGQAKSAWGTNCNTTETRAVFVDELSCIGCRMCNNLAGDTFGMEDLWGRARVKTQWGNNEEEISDAIDSCPVDCIYWVQRKQLPLLEYIMGLCNRITVASMMNGRAAPDSPFSRAEYFLKQRKEAKWGPADGSMLHNERLSNAIAKAWLQLPAEIRQDLWPQYAELQGDTN
eukprot:CAMPEP_0167785200 /NCGR_PEP_ID=MMETSP0111_2-20121227/8105_1 /TAXON_ID=91324 /ORGANISM="Lotharella globosa, Strain CCCM811" /LENGTH=305 /DNA_ID=CAMNT_0007676445 /DNA_START=312 /DNA_END=1229 /DNA_ORIENTATION=-